MEELIEEVGARLIEAIRPLRRCLVAYSGGVDSAVVAYAARAALGEHAIAVTGVSASLASGELDAARRVAAAIGIEFAVLTTEETAAAAYQRNAPDRCFHCKTELYAKLREEADRRGVKFILNGANADDLGDFRPGMTAAANAEVRSPLADEGLDKSAVRALAKFWNLEVWDKPATPCLSSRVAYGVAVTPERLAMVDQAEAALRRLGFGLLRVRLHENNLARLEVPVAELPRLVDESVRSQIAEELRLLGFHYVTLDLEGLRSGSFQQLVSPDDLVRFGHSPMPLKP
jgi:pyridinium-3,5-biscarboxylic acid mononucleotide sulfurtransferase